MRGDPGAGSDPDTLDRLALAKVDMIGFVKPFKIIVHVDRREVDRGRVALPLIGVDPGENLGQARATGAEIHSHRFVVEQPIAAARLTDIDGEGALAPMVEQIGASGCRALQPRAYERPVGDEAAHDERRIGLLEVGIEISRRQLSLGDAPQGLGRGRRGVSHRRAFHSFVRPAPTGSTATRAP